MTAPRPRDLVVVGGGVIGLAVAWRAAAAGHRVTVVDPAPGPGASWAAAGMLAPVGEAHFGEDALTRLNVAAARAWPDFAQAPRGGLGDGRSTTGPGGPCWWPPTPPTGPPSTTSSATSWTSASPPGA